MRKNLLSIGLAAALGLGASVAYAAPISLPAGPVYFQFNNLEQVCITNCISVPGGGTEGNWGAFNISSMQYGSFSPSNEHTNISGGPTFFSDDGVGGTSGQISGIFYGFQVTGDRTQSGGYMDLYWEDAGDDDITNTDMNGNYSPTNRTSADQFGKFTDGTFLARLQFMPGVVTGDATTTVRTNTEIGVILGDPDAQGQANSYADVMDINGDGKIDGADGAWAGALNGDWFFVDVNGNGVKGENGERRDIRFSNLFDKLTEWDDTSNTNIKGLRSNDPGRVFVVPEPTSLALLGIGLLGAGFSSRRRNAKA